MVDLGKVHLVFGYFLLISVGFVPVTALDSLSNSQGTFSHTAEIYEDGKIVDGNRAVPTPAGEISCDLYAHAVVTRGSNSSMECYSDVYTKPDTGERCYICAETGNDHECSPCGGGMCFEPE